MTDPTPEKLDYASSNVTSAPRRDWVIMTASALVYLVILGMTIELLLVWSHTSATGYPASELLIHLGLLALVVLLEIGCMFQMTAAAIPLILVMLFFSAGVIAVNFQRPLQGEPLLIARGGLVVMAFMVFGHCRWYAAMRAAKAEQRRQEQQQQNSIDDHA